MSVADNEGENPIIAFARLFVWSLYRPLDAFDELKTHPRGPLLGTMAVTLVGVVWAAFSFKLYMDGHAPSRASPWVPRADHYRLQAGFVVPTLWLGCVVWALLCRTGGHRHLPRLGIAIGRGALGVAEYPLY